MTPTPIILDCDPGHDDAIAILLAVASPELDLRAVTTVSGNQTLDKTTNNALRVLELAGRTDIPVYAGADAPFVRQRDVAAHVHGESGLDGPDLPQPSQSQQAEHAVESLAQAYRGPEKPVLVATGPLTNVGLLFATHADARPERIILMGGSIGEGNTTASAEFNIIADPEAADVVFRSGVPITMIGLDVTHQALLDRDSAAELRALGNVSGRVAAELTDFALDRNMEWSGSTTTAIHDAVAIAHLMVPDLVAVAPYHVAVDTTNGPARGRTICDGLPYRLKRDGRTPNADVGIVIDRARFERLLIDAFARLP